MRSQNWPERSFSSLKRIKSSLRSTMSEDRLNNLAILSIEKNISADLNVERVVDVFASKHNNRRICLKYNSIFKNVCNDQF